MYTVESKVDLIAWNRVVIYCVTVVKLVLPEHCYGFTCVKPPHLNSKNRLVVFLLWSDSYKSVSQLQMLQMNVWSQRFHCCIPSVCLSH